VTSQFWRPAWACAQRVRVVGLCIGAILLTATPALSSGAFSVNSFGTWKWNGSSWSLCTEPVAASKIAIASVASPLTFSAMADSDSNSNGGTASLSGYVYLDMDQDGEIDNTDWAICDAKIQLTMSDGSDSLFVFSGKDGSYHFDGLLDGNYSITMVTPVTVPGQDKGEWWILGEDKTTIVSTGPSGPLLPNAYESIALGAGQKGENFSFAEWVYPVDAYTKRMFMGDYPGIIHTTPEPGSLALLAMAGLFFGGLTWRRRRP
jgi:hypothetical protein